MVELISSLLAASLAQLLALAPLVASMAAAATPWMEKKGASARHYRGCGGCCLGVAFPSSDRLVEGSLVAPRPSSRGLEVFS